MAAPTNADIDHAANMMGIVGITPDDIRESLVSRGLSEYDCYLCYKAAKHLLRNGFYTRGVPVEG